MVLDRGEHEGLKAAVHGVLGSLTAVCAVYNACACYRRPTWHLAVNATIYTAVAALEVKQVRRHLEPSP